MNAHSPEAVAAYPETEWTQIATVNAFRDAFDAGRASVRHFGVADRELRAQIMEAGRLSLHTAGYGYKLNTEELADRVLALSPTQLTSTREALKTALLEVRIGNEAVGVWLNDSEAEQIADALLQSGVLVERGVVEAEALEAAKVAVGELAYIRDWDGYTVDDAAHAVRCDALDAIDSVSKREGNGQ